MFKYNNLHSTNIHPVQVKLSLIAIMKNTRFAIDYEFAFVNERLPNE